MKAFLLAGGRGERLRPLTDQTPKCLVPINGTPLLGIWLDSLERQGVSDVLLNVSHHADQVRAFLDAWRRGPQVHLVVEPTPLGNAGTVAANRWFVADVDDFWIFYADNLTTVRLEPMLGVHRRHDGVLTMGLFHAPDPRAAGIVTTDAVGRVVAFEEKPRSPRGTLASAGIYLARRSLMDAIPVADRVVDFGHDVLPHLVGRMFGHEIDGFLMDVGTSVSLARATTAWASLRAGGASA